MPLLLFSEYLRDLLQAKKMTVSALSRLSGVERTALSKALTGAAGAALRRPGRP